MDLSGRGPAYRGVTVRCPGCSEAMRCEAVPSAEIDVCDACGGLWVDWFDGEIETLAAEAAAAREQGAWGAVFNDPRRATAATTCPRCLQGLRPELYRFSNARAGELVDGVELFRCPECAGSYVPRSSAHLLLERLREPRTVTLFQALVDLLRRLVGP